MATFLILLLANLLDPIRVVPAVIAGLSVGKWWQVALATVLISIVMIIIAAGLGMNSNPAIGFIATAIAVSVPFAIKRGFRKPKSPI